MPPYAQDWLKSPFPVNGQAGAHFHVPTKEQSFQLGLTIDGSDGTKWRYGRAAANVAANATVGFTTAGLTTTGTTHRAIVAFTANDYGWFREE